MEWTKDLAYAVGLIVADGSLSKDGRHIDLTSKDRDLIETFSKILHLTNKIGEKRVKTSSVNYYRVQMGNIQMYKFLLSIGLMPNKSTIISEVKIPKQFFRDYLRGYFDGDGCTYSYFDNRWKNSYMLYTSFTSGSIQHLEWLKGRIKTIFKLEGRITYLFRGGYQLRYARNSSYILLKKMYYKHDIPCLGRKRSKIEQSLGIIDTLAGVSKLVYEHA